MLRFLLACGLATLVGAASDAGIILTPERVALVVGNQDYQGSVADLQTPARDATLVAEALADQGFEVTLEQDVALDRFKVLLDTFGSKARMSDIALIYYSGHGFDWHGESWLVATDSILAFDRDPRRDAVALQELVAHTAGASSLRMVILDASRTAPPGRPMRRKASVAPESALRNLPLMGHPGTPVPSGLILPGFNDQLPDGDDPIDDAHDEPEPAAEPEDSPGSVAKPGQAMSPRSGAAGDNLVIAYATAAGEFSLDGPEGGNSPFAAAFVEALAGPPRDVALILRDVRDRVRHDGEADPAPLPFVYSSLGADPVILNPNSPVQDETGR